MLGATPHQVYGEFDQGAREAAAKKGTGETAWAPGACWVGTTSFPNLVLTRTCWCPFRVNMSGLFKFGRWALFESLLIYLIIP